MATEARDSLKSKATLKILDLLGEGPIGGLVDGQRSIFLDNTQLQNADGAYNFNGITTDFREGTNTQSPIPTTDSFTETPFTIGVAVKKTQPFTFAVTNREADKIRVIMTIPSLMTTNSGNGDMNGTSVEYKFSVSVDQAPYIDLIVDGASSVVTVSGKSRAKYQRNHILDIPSSSLSVSIRVSRITDDSTSIYLSNDTFVDSVTEIVSLNLSYPNSVLSAMTVDSAQFSKIPARSFLVDGLYIRVPTNYNATTKTYSGIWNGSFKTAISSNPAWVLFDLLTHKRYGLGAHIEDGQVDKAMLYTIGKYCDELVPNGFGGTEPRFALNTIIYSQADAYKVITDITSAFRGMAFWDGGAVNFTQDSPSDPMNIYGLANVIGGDFVYTGSARKNRHSVVSITWNDPDNFYQQKVEYVEDRDLISKYGIRKMDSLAFGCTSRGQAARVGKWILYTEKYESDSIQFKVGSDSALVVPGNIIKIQDPSRSGKRMAGRLVSCTTTVATLDAPMIIASTPATISLMLEDGTFVDRVLTQAVGTYTQVSWSQALTVMPVANGMWMVSEVNLVPILARVVGLSQGANPGEFEIIALEHNPTKFGAIENGLALVARPTSIIDPSFIQIPTDINVSESIYLVAPGVIGNKLFVSWHGSCTRYDVSYRGIGPLNASNWINVTVTDSPSLEIGSALLGAYEINITGINPLGKRSTTVLTTYTVHGKITPPSNISQFISQTSDQGIVLSWQPITDVDLLTYEIRKSLTPGSGWATATLVTQTTTTPLVLSSIVSGAHEYLIKAVDMTGGYSATPTVTNLVVLNPSTPIISSTFQQSNVKLVWTSAKTSFAIASYEVRIGSVLATAATFGTMTTQTFSTTANWVGSQRLWVIPRDIYGNLGTGGSIDVVISPASAPVLTRTIVGGNYVFNWTEPASTLPILDYEIRTGASFSSGTFVAQISATTFSQKIDWAGSKTFWIAAEDSAGNLGTSVSEVINVSMPVSPVPTAVISGSALIISWAVPAASTLALDGYEVRYGSGVWATQTIVSTLKGNTVTIPIQWVGDRVFSVASIDSAGNVSTPTSITTTINIPTLISTTSTFLADQFALSWIPPASTLAITEYEIRYGQTWIGGLATAVRIKGTEFRTTAQWAGSRRWWIAAIDINGNYGQQTSSDVTINPPPPPVITQQVVDNNVLLYWNDTASTLPILTYELRRGDAWDTALVIGKKSGGFTTVFETVSGTYKYWLAGIDTANNYGTPSFVSIQVSQPPDYILRNDFYSAFSGTKVNMAQDTDGGYIMPVNDIETFSAHFTSHAWSTPNDQINAGYPIYIEPASANGSYEEVIDYGSVLPPTKISLTLSSSKIAGTPTINTAISVKAAAGDAWVDYLNQSSVFVGGFRYVKIKITVSGSDTSLFKIYSINVKLDAKLKGDSGSGFSGATDSVSGGTCVINGVTSTTNNPLNAAGLRVPDGIGTLTTFTLPFLDVSSITVAVAASAVSAITPTSRVSILLRDGVTQIASSSAASSPKYGLYDFVDVPNAAGFRVMLYDQNGTRVSGAYSWTAQGY